MNALVLSLAFVAPAQSEDVYSQLQAFARVLNTVETTFIERLPTRKLLDAAIAGMISVLDSHSQYVPRDAYQKIRGDVPESPAEVGIDCERSSRGLRILSVFPESPADRSGVLAGDALVAIDGRVAESLTVDAAKRLLTGPPGSRVVVRVHREGFVVPRDFTLQREVIPPNPLRVSMVGTVMHARLLRFSEGAAKVFERAVLAKKPSAIVLDLRDNQGGLVEQAVRIVDFFLASGDIVSTVGRDGQILESYRAKPPAATMPLVVLVNENSASAAEIVAASLQDASRARILGVRTYGKASVQTIVELDDGSALKLTTGRYFTPKQTEIDKRGVTPDLVLDRGTDWVQRAMLEVQRAMLEVQRK